MSGYPVLEKDGIPIIIIKQTEIPISNIKENIFNTIIR